MRHFLTSRPRARPQSFLHRRDDLRARRHDAEKRRRAAVDHDVPVHGDLELAVPPVDQIHVGLKLTAETRRHTGGVDAGHSIRAVVNRYAGHEKSSSRARGAGPEGWAPHTLKLPISHGAIGTVDEFALHVAIEIGHDCDLRLKCGAPRCLSQRRFSRRGGGGRKTRSLSDQTQLGQGSGPALCRIRHNDSYRSPTFIISVIPVLNGGGFCPIALPEEKHTYAQCFRLRRPGLHRMLVKVAGVLLAAARTHFPAGRKRLLAETLKTNTCWRWLPLFLDRTKVPLVRRRAIVPDPAQ